MGPARTNRSPQAEESRGKVITNRLYRYSLLPRAAPARRRQERINAIVNANGADRSPWTAPGRRKRDHSVPYTYFLAPAIRERWRPIGVAAVKCSRIQFIVMPFFRYHYFNDLQDGRLSQPHAERTRRGRRPSVSEPNSNISLLSDHGAGHPHCPLRTRPTLPGLC